MTIEVDPEDWKNREYRRAVMATARRDAKRERTVYKIVTVKGRIRELKVTIDARHVEAPQ